MTLDPRDVREDTFTAGNSVSIRLIHIPTGLSTEAATDGTRFLLRSKLLEKLELKVAQHLESLC